MNETTSWRAKESGLALNHDWDVVVVGGGPAGLFAALGVLSATRASVLLLDEGHDIEGRHSAAWPPTPGPAISDEYVEGIGGAGLFSDGKLCMSLDVGGRLEHALDEVERRRLLALIQETFEGLLGVRHSAEANPSQVAHVKERAERVGLDFKYYPVLHIGTDRCSLVIRAIRDCLVRRKATIVAECRLMDLSVSDNGVKRLVVKHAGTTLELRAQQVVLAMGKVGAAHQTAFCRKLGIGISSRPMYLGMRLETDARVLAPLFALSKDPKYSLRLADGSKIKTHCASENGQVLDLHYDGLPLAGGHNFRDHSTGRSGFSVLWDGYRWPGEAYDAARSLMQRIGATTNGQLLAHAWTDYKKGRSSDTSSLANLPLSQPHCAPGDVRQFLPADYFSACDDFLDRLARLCPELPGKTAVFYAPAIEWWMNRINTEQHMETACRGLYSCGDGSGWSQGIVHAAATGLWASEGISGGRVSPEQLRQVLSGFATQG